MISPVIHFSGDCFEALELYEQAFPITQKHVKFRREAPDENNMDISEAMLDHVMHSTIEMCGTKFNMSDIPGEVISGDMVCFNVFMETEAEVMTAYEVLRKEGTIVQDIGPQFFARLYTVVVDKFSVRWQIIRI